MNTEEARAVASVSLFAAFADGEKSDAERGKIRDVIAGLGDASMTEALRRVMFKETTLKAEAALLKTPELRTLAWETALAVCEADGETSAVERAFLDELAALLGRPSTEARSEVADADAMRRSATSGSELAALPVVAAAALAPDPRGAEVDATTLRYAILTAAVELLPQNLATLAIIPLQTKMVHSIGKTYGHSLSAASIGELAATVGVGLTGQVVEQYARKLLGKLGRSVLGGIGKTAANWGTGPALTFATTYAMGMVAKQYYGGGRTLSAFDLKALFAGKVEEAKQLYARYEPQVRQTAATTDPRQLLASLRA